ncbi:MAG: family 43 glycosylhydrolase [Calditrichaceae bacterium]|nr:family 43 glycosylhydrolase [Calditrichaceae bacterium]
MKKICVQLSYVFVIWIFAYGQSPSFETYINPIIPGDHPDPTLTKVGKYFYTSGSSFNPTPKIYRSTDLVHWEVIAQPVSASWPVYGDEPGGGIWGGHTVYYNNSYWHFFARGGVGMFFVKADNPEGPWSEPTAITSFAGLPPFGQDNSIFIDEDTGKWYMLTKAGQENNHLVELNDDGQPTGEVLDLTWLNPNSEGNPYGWAEGPVMWKYKGYYYYGFTQHLVGEQYVMRSDTLTDDESEWTIKDGNVFTGSPATYNRPNHISPVVMIDDSTSWTIAHSYHSSSNWYAHGRQGLLCQVTYDEQGFPVIQYPPSSPVPAPDLPSTGIPWMVPKSDMFNGTTLSPNWSFLGYTSGATYSLEVQEGWLYLEPYGGSNTVIQNDGEHSYSLITRVDFEPTSVSNEAGLWILNGPETHFVKVFSTVNSEGNSSVAFSFESTKYEVENTFGSIVWLKLVRNEHTMSGYFSPDGSNWVKIGEDINALNLDIPQPPDFNAFTGNQQGLYVKGREAYFDLYIYRDAYTDIMAKNPTNRYGVSSASTYLSGINNDDWAMYAGVEFGDSTEYPKIPVSFGILASSDNSGGMIEVWLDSIDTGTKVSECQIDSTGGWNNYQVFSSDMESVSGTHDVYLKFVGSGGGDLFRIQFFRFLTEGDSITSLNENAARNIPQKFGLKQNYPNPFNPKTTISYTVGAHHDMPLQHIYLSIYNLLGQKVATLVNEKQPSGNYKVGWDAGNYPSGVYFYKLETDNGFSQTKKLMLIK